MFSKCEVLSVNHRNTCSTIFQISNNIGQQKNHLFSNPCNAIKVFSLFTPRSRSKKLDTIHLACFLITYEKSMKDPIIQIICIANNILT